MVEKLDDPAIARSKSLVHTPKRRREGFRGQCQVVIPETTRREFGAHPLLRGLFVTDAGFYPNAEGHLVERPDGAPTHLIIACLRGKGWVTGSGRRYQLERGGVVGLPANQPHAYGSQDDTPWSIAWVHFTGDEGRAWLELALGRSDVAATCHVPPERLDVLGLDRVHGVLESGYGLRELAEAAAGLRVTLASLSRLRVQTAASVSAQERVAASVERIRTDYQSSFRVSEMAAAAGLSVTHFTALFRAQTGYPPLDYLIRVRVQRAASLLLTTDATVGQITALCGFSDPYYFTRCFTRLMGSSPRTYRKTAT